jgi:phage tail sheath gpL-like
VVDFATIPAAGSLRTPFLFLEMDNSRAGSPGTGDRPILMIGGRTSAGSVAAGVLKRVASDRAASGYWGEGSILHHMMRGIRAANQNAEVWGVAVDDAVAGVAATQTITVAGAATAAGTVALYIAGTRIPVAVASGDAANAIATAIDAAITATAGLPVTSAAVPPVVTCTAKNKGLTGNQIDIRTNYLDTDEDVPGVTVTVAAGVAGATNPDISGIAALLGDEEFDFIVHPYLDSTSLDEIEELLNFTAGRWAWNRMVYGHAFCAYCDTPGNLTTLGNAENDPNNTIVGLEALPTLPWEVAGTIVGRIYRSLSDSPARPLQTLELPGVLPAAKTVRWTQAQRNVLLFDGISTLTTDSAGKVRIERLISTYQLDAQGVADDSYLDVCTMYTSAEFDRRIDARIRSDWPRHSLANDDTPIGPGQAVTTPRLLKGSIVSEYGLMEKEGLVENAELFERAITIVRPPGDPNRIDIEVNPDYVNQLRIVAIKNAFLLQYLAD